MFKVKNKSLVLIALTVVMAIFINGCTKGAPEGVVATVNKEDIEQEAFDREYEIQSNAIQNQLG